MSPCRTRDAWGPCSGMSRDCGAAVLFCRADRWRMEHGAGAPFGLGPMTARQRFQAIAGQRIWARADEIACRSGWGSGYCISAKRRCIHWFHGWYVLNPGISRHCRRGVVLRHSTVSAPLPMILLARCPALQTGALGVQLGSPGGQGGLVKAFLVLSITERTF